MAGVHDISQCLNPATAPLLRYQTPAVSPRTPTMGAQLVLRAAAEAPGGTTGLSGPLQRASLAAGMWHGVGEPERLGGRGRAVQAPYPGDNNRWHHSLTGTPLNVRTTRSCKNTLRSGDP